MKKLPAKERWIDKQNGDRVLMPDISICPLIRDWKAIAASDVPVLITGETGTGKEELANLIHAHSQCESQPFESINCVGVEGNLIMSELFGHKKGAFTGADKDRNGKLLAVNGGTVLLDELGALELRDQARILRFMQSGEIQPLGSDTTTEVNVRVIATTNVDPNDDKKLRPDLRNRFTFEINLPPLRDRGADVISLLMGFLRPFNTYSGITLRTLFDLAWYGWPGNIRQLENFCQATAIVARHKLSEGTKSMHIMNYRAGDIHKYCGRAAPAFSGTLEPFDPFGHAKTFLGLYQEKRDRSLTGSEEQIRLQVNMLKLMAQIYVKDYMPHLGKFHPDPFPLESLCGPPGEAKAYCYDSSVLAEKDCTTKCRYEGKWSERKSREFWSVTKPEPMGLIDLVLRFKTMARLFNTSTTAEVPSVDYIEWIRDLPSSIPDYGEVRAPTTDTLEKKIQNLNSRKKVKEVAHLYASGKTYAEIGEKHQIPHSTAQDYVSSIKTTDRDLYDHIRAQHKKNKNAR